MNRLLQLKNQYPTDLFNVFVVRLRSANAHLFVERTFANTFTGSGCVALAPFRRMLRRKGVRKGVLKQGNKQTKCEQQTKKV